MNSSPLPILSEIDAFLARTKMAPTMFGGRAVGDPNLLRNLRAGRELRTATTKRVRDFIAAQELAA